VTLHSSATGFRIRIALADDHAILRESLKMLLNMRDGIEVVAEYANGREAAEGVAKTPPDVVLMDMAMPLLNGIEATRQIKRSQPAVKVIVMSSFVSADQVRDAINAGASGYLTKLTKVDELLLAVQSVNRGNSYFSADITEQFDVAALTEEARSPEQRSSASRLSIREREVLQLLAEGYTSKRIAAELFISAKTVEGHKARIMEKLQVKTRTDLIRFALVNGIKVEESPQANAG
jgi:DNA-binding NarL/FixJ family response regulator